MKFGTTLGWRYVLPLIAACLPVGPAKAMAKAFTGDEEAAAFQKTVKAFQASVGLEADGEPGPNTWERFAVGATVCLLGLKAANALGVTAVSAKLSAPAFQGAPADGLLQNYVRIGGCPVPVPASIKVRLDHRKRQLVGRKGCVARNVIVLHWGGLDASGCYNTLAGRQLGTHLIASHAVGTDGVLDILQACDLADTAFHAGEVNRFGIGFDIARSPLVNFLSKYPGSKAVPNPCPRGEEQIIPLPANYGPTLRPFLAWLAQVFGLDYTYQGHQVIDPEADGTVKHPENLRGVLGHHNVDQHKWDVACWAADLWPAAGETYDFKATTEPVRSRAVRPMAAVTPAAPVVPTDGPPSPAAGGDGEGQAAASDPAGDGAPPSGQE